MKAKVVHIDLNPCGGAERVAIATIQALLEMGIETDVAALRAPDLKRLGHAFGEHSVRHMSKIKTSIAFSSNDNYDLVINTHGDILPYYPKDKCPFMVYCHFPIAKYTIDSKNSRYLSLIQAFNRTNDAADQPPEALRERYGKMIRNSVLLTNSEFSQRALSKSFGIDSTIVYPPVDVDSFRNSLRSDNRGNTILVVSRINPTKKIENAIRLAALLKADGVGDRMVIVGNLSPECASYFSYLQQLVENYNLTDYVKLEANVSFDRLLQLMAESKVYFHTLPGEPFGISTAEAMSAGVIPIVPDIGGHNEFVPNEYQFHKFDAAVKLISSALHKPQCERERISMLVNRFSVSNYIHNIKQIVVQNN
jgi:glycosyltransferase involved in cell wall biosynthesis